MLEMTKGQTLDLHKESGTTLTKIRLGAGWDVTEGKTMDLDLWLIPKGGAPVYFNHKTIPGASLDKDDLTGGSSADGADENIAIDVAALEKEEYTVMINIYDAVNKGQFFKDVKRAFIEVEDVVNKKVVFNYNISEHGGDNFTLVAGKLVKKGSSLEFVSDAQFSTKTADVVVREVGGVV